MIDTSDGILAIKSKHIAVKAQGQILKHLSKSEKKDLFALNAISGTHIDKFRLLSDKSTQNVSIDAVHTDIKELEDRERVLQERLKELTGRADYGAEMGNNPEIVDVNGEEET